MRAKRVERRTARAALSGWTLSSVAYMTVLTARGLTDIKSSRPWI